MIRWGRQRRDGDLDDATRELVLRCLEVERWSQIYFVVRDHPQLLDAPVDDFLDQLAEAASPAVQDPEKIERFRNDVAVVRHILGRCREVGPADALLEVSLQTRSQDDPAFAAAVAGLQEAGQRGDVDAMVEAGETALAMVDPEMDPATWAAIAEATASGLAQSPTGDRAARLREAERLFLAVADIYHPEVDPHKSAATSVALAMIAEARGDVDGALARQHAAAEAPGLRERAPFAWADAHLETARLLLVRSVGRRDPEELAQAAEHCRRALEVFTEEDTRPQWTAAHGHLASALYAAGGDPAEILRHAELALRGMSPSDDPERAAALRGMMEHPASPHGPAFDAVRRGMTEWAVSRHPALLEQVIADGADALATDGFEGDPAALAEVKLLLGVAYTYRLQGDRPDNIERAIALLEEAATLTEEDADLAGIADALGTCFQRRAHGDPGANRERAIAHYQEAADRYDAAGDRASWALAQRNLATAYWNPEDPTWADRIPKAIEHSHLALTGLSREQQPYDWSGVHVNLAAYHAALAADDGEADAARAIEHGRLALEVRTREEFPLDWAQIQLNLGGAHLAAGDQGQAIEHMRAAMEVYTPEANPYEARRLGRKVGDLLFARRDWEAAADAYGTALAAAERLYQSALYRRSRDLEIGATGDLHHRLAYALARCGAAADAAATLEAARGRALRETMGEDIVKLRRLAEADPGALHQYVVARQRLEQLQKWERSAEGTPVVEMTREQAQRFVQDVDPDRSPPMQIVFDSEAVAEQREIMRKVDRDREARTRAEYEQVWDDLAQVVERIRAIPGLEDFEARPSITDVAAAARPELPLAYLVATPAGSMSLLVRPGAGGDASVEPVWSDFTSADLADVLLGADGPGYLEGQANVTDLVDGLGTVLDRLGELVYPLATRLRELGATRVALVPMGWLGTLPIHAARWQDAGGAPSLIDVVDVTYVPSAHALAMLHVMAAATERNPEVLCGVADPQPLAGSLPYARDELEAAAARFPEARAFYGEDATRANLLGALSTATHVHLACHGVNNPTNPLFSHFEFPDGPLDMRDIRYGELASLATVRLAVLSACESAIAATRLPDEMVGLPTALLLAGVPATMGTLWQAPDLPTALLMTKFYELLRGGPDDAEQMAPMRALSRAQRWLRDATLDELRRHVPPGGQLAAGLDAELHGLAPGDRPFQNQPVMWAPFAAFGV